MTTTLHPVEDTKRRQGEREKYIARLAMFTSTDLNDADLGAMRRLRDAHASLTEAENELEEVKERCKLRKKALQEAIRNVVDHYEERQLALGFGGK